MTWTAAAFCVCALAADPAPRGDRYFKITVVDEQTGRGVPLIELQTVSHLRYYTDSNGVVAFYEPGLMDQTVFFLVQGHGYEFAKDGLGFRGKALEVKEGGSAKLSVRRLNIAERLYRVTGGGIYGDSVLVAEPAEIKHPLLNAQVFGSDSVVNAQYRGKLYWFWGDTNRPGHPLGNYHVPGATSRLPADGGVDPEKGVELEYFLDDKGFAKETAHLPGEGPTWVGGLTVLGERMFASYVKVRGQLDVYERGLVEWDDAKKEFKKVVKFDLAAPLYPHGHPFLRSEDGIEYVYYGDPFPLVRVRADPNQLRDPARYEAFTCLQEGSRSADERIDRADGRARYAWKKNTPPVGPQDQERLVRAGKLRADEALLQLQEADTGKPVVAASGSVAWNEHRRRWVMIAAQIFGTSVLGEVWYAEADTPLGPWVYARKVVTHEKYSFYNPTQHPLLAKDKGRIIFFEGTYSTFFSGNDYPTPRYDYNQIMYKLDVDDPRLALPAAVYQTSRGAPERFGVGPHGAAAWPLAFFAPDRPLKDSLPVYQDAAGLHVGKAPDAKAVPLFHALSVNLRARPLAVTPLYEFVSEDGKHRAYSTDAKWSQSGYVLIGNPICLVWRNPAAPAKLAK